MESPLSPLHISLHRWASIFHRKEQRGGEPRAQCRFPARFSTSAHLQLIFLFSVERTPGSSLLRQESTYSVTASELMRGGVLIMSSEEGRLKQLFIYQRKKSNFHSSNLALLVTLLYSCVQWRKELFSKAKEQLSIFLVG